MLELFLVVLAAPACERENENANRDSAHGDLAAKRNLHAVNKQARARHGLVGAIPCPTSGLFAERSAPSGLRLRAERGTGAASQWRNVSKRHGRSRPIHRPDCPQLHSPRARHLPGYPGGMVSRPRAGRALERWGAMSIARIR